MILQVSKSQSRGSGSAVEMTKLRKTIVTDVSWYLLCRTLEMLNGIKTGTGIKRNQTM